MSKRELREKLAEIRAIATMENAGFNLMWPDAKDPLPTTENQVTPFIRERTRLWRASWIIGPLDEIIKELDGEPVPNIFDAPYL